MKNKEKYEERVLTFACDESGFGVCEETGEMERCSKMHCNACLFYRKKETCHTNRRKWLEQEYIEKPVISKRDRAFLEYIDSGYKHVTRDANGRLDVWCDKPSKGLAMWLSCNVDLVNDNSFGIFGFTIDFPMVKWEDDKPWLIEDLKKLDVVDSYE